MWAFRTDTSSIFIQTNSVWHSLRRFFTFIPFQLSRCGDRLFCVLQLSSLAGSQSPDISSKASSKSMSFAKTSESCWCILVFQAVLCSLWLNLFHYYCYYYCHYDYYYVYYYDYDYFVIIIIDYTLPHTASCWNHQASKLALRRPFCTSSSPLSPSSSCHQHSW